MKLFKFLNFSYAVEICLHSLSIPSPNKASSYLFFNSPMTIPFVSQFTPLRYKDSFDPAAIGDYLGEGGITPTQIDYWNQIRYKYTRAVSFVHMELEVALRLYLTGCGFRLPGEAQKIDRFVEVFCQTFLQDNALGSTNCPFRGPSLQLDLFEKKNGL